MKDTSRTIKAAIAALVGLFLVFINPGLVNATVNKLLLGMTEGGTVAMGSVPALRMYVSSYWRGLECHPLACRRGPGKSHPNARGRQPRRGGKGP
ncbi:MAG: hypothetical protein AB1649_30080 [Chloroflexota bacterium]